MARVYIKGILNGPGSRILLSIFTGQSLGQIFALFATIVLASLYKPVDFASFAIFASLVAILTPFLTGSLDSRIIYEPSLDQVNRIKAASLIYVLSSCSSLLIISLIIRHSFIEESTLSWHGEASSLVDIAIFASSLIACRLIAESALLREQRMMEYNIVAILPVVLTPILSGLLWILGFKEMGLIVGFILSSCATTLITLRSYISFKSVLRVSLSDIFLTLKKNASYPLLLSTSSVLDAITASLPVLIGNTTIGSIAIGNFVLTQKLFLSPIGIIANSVSKTYSTRLSAHLKKQGFNLFRYTIYLISALLTTAGAIWFIAFYLVFPLIAIVLPEDWSSALQIVKLLSPAVLIKFIASSVSASFMVTSSKYLLVYWKLLAFVSTFFVLQFLAGKNWIYYFQALAITDVALYGLLLALVLYSCRQSDLSRG